MKYDFRLEYKLKDVIFHAKLSLVLIGVPCSLVAPREATLVQGARIALNLRLGVCFVFGYRLPVLCFFSQGVHGSFTFGDLVCSAKNANTCTATCVAPCVTFAQVNQISFGIWFG